MEENLQALEKFFNYNFQIKQLITFYPEIQSQESAIEYTDKMDKNLKDIKYMLKKMLTIIRNSTILHNHLDNLFDYYEKALAMCGNDQEALANFYRNCISNMNPSLINEMNQEIKGHYIFSDMTKSFLNSKTINEMLHVLHRYVVNTEWFYESMPVLEKKTYNEDKITLYGRPNNIAKMIFDHIDFNLESRQIDILSLNNNKILIMARDLGHALTMEIELTNKEAYVSYFIPKICNINMVNKLKGITPVKIDEDGNLKTPYATGSFKVSEEELLPNIIELMENIPRDQDMIIESKNTR